METEVEEKECNEAKYLTKEDTMGLQGADFINIGNKDTEKNLWMIKLKDRYVLVKREGKCDSSKCNSICCKFCHAAYIKDYSRGFFDREDEYGNCILDRKCNNLSKCGKCNLWGKKLPNACKHFPHPNDSVYWHIMDKCTFKFKILYTIRLADKEKVRKEMIKCFENQLY